MNSDNILQQEETIPKKRRGRPKGSKNKPKGLIVDQPKRKRGRPKGSKNNIKVNPRIAEILQTWEKIKERTPEECFAVLTSTSIAPTMNR